ncbi:hypothetical protein SMD22_00725 (plasmid) [Brevibacillus halotolerans]|nr:hypothetical protein SMD22_00725 [Brevibacillus halotolerans]
MDINQVIELGKQIQAPSNMFGLGAWGTLGVLAIAMLIVGFIVIYFGFTYCEGFLPLGFLALISGIFLLFGNEIIEIKQAREKYSENVERWKREFVTPYIDSLPKEKKEIVFIKIESELSSDTVSNRWYTYMSEVKRTPLTVSFKENNSITTLTDWYDASMELTNEKEAFVEYQKVPVNLGHGMDAGYYNLNVHLPDSYKFIEIK